MRSDDSADNAVGNVTGSNAVSQRYATPLVVSYVHVLTMLVVLYLQVLTMGCGGSQVNVFLGLGLPWLIASVYWVASIPCYMLSLAFPMKHSVLTYVFHLDRGQLGPRRSGKRDTLAGSTTTSSVPAVEI